MKTIEELHKDWMGLIPKIVDIHSILKEPSVPEDIFLLAKKIGALNQSIQTITMNTLEILLHIKDENPLVCKECQGVMDIDEDEISCGNPLCKLNEYIT